MDRIIIRNLGLKPYEVIWKRMQNFTNMRTEESLDEIWLVEHFPVFTQGQAGKAEHLLHPSHIPVVKTDRGGQITYHGPGQLIAYVLLDLHRKSLNIKILIHALEDAIIAVLKEYDIAGERKCGAPGIYVKEAKIAFLGLKIRRHCSYHGLSLNVAMDLAPFKQINPCGYPNLPVIQMRDFKEPLTLLEITPKLTEKLVHYLNYNTIIEDNKELYDYLSH